VQAPAPAAPADGAAAALAGPLAGPAELDTFRRGVTSPAAEQDAEPGDGQTPGDVATSAAGFTQPPRDLVESSLVHGDAS
jgi:hypothetical protein